MPNKHKQGWFSNYCGLGGEGSTQHATDEACKTHDEDYNKIQKRGADPYWTYNAADERFQKRLKNVRSTGKIRSIREKAVNYAGDAFVELKKHTLPRDQATMHRPSKLRRVSSPADEDMDLDPDGNYTDGTESDAVPTQPGGNHPGNTLATARATGNTAVGRDETRVTPSAPSYLLPETHTALIPLDVFFSVVTNGYSPQLVEISMTSIVNPFMTQLSDGGTAALSAGVWNKPVPLNANSFQPGAIFPTTAGTGDKREKGWNQQYWEIQYQYYHVMKATWKATIMNCGITDANYGEVFHQYQDYGNKDDNVIPETCPYEYMIGYKNIKHELIPADGSNSTSTAAFTSIEGDYYPGQAKTNIKTDELTKTWTLVDSNPALTESLRLYFYSGALSGAVPAVGKFNIRLSVKYIVQFKDLRGPFKYPGQYTSTSVSTSDLTYKTNISA